MFFKQKINSDGKLALLFGGVLLLLIIFNVLSGLLFGYVAADVTADKRYELSQPTINLLQENKAPIIIRLYISRDLKQASPRYGAYADYVNRMLNQYVEYGHSRIKLELVEITPYSSAEIAAEKVGLHPLAITDSSHDVYLGANIIHASGAALSIPVFDIKRKSMLEDDISRSISRLNAPKAPLIGIISPYFNVASSGKVIAFNDDWPFIKQLKAFGFRIKPLGSSMAFIPEDIDAVLLYYPLALKPLNLYAIDQYLLRGGNVMVMLDAFSELKFTENNTYDLYDSGMQAFLQNLGVEYYNDMLIGDLQNNQNVIIDGKNSSYPLYLKVYSSQMAAHPITARLHDLKLNYSSLFNFDVSKSKLRSTVLYSSGKQSGILPAAWASQQSFATLKQKIKSEDMQFPLALLLEGNFPPFYREPLINRSELVLKMPLFADRAQKEGKLLLTGDSDMAAWSLWRGGSSDGNAQFFSSDNMLFIRSALDYLSSSDYSNVGQKFLTQSKYNLKDIIRMAAEDQNTDQRNIILQQLQDTRRQINQIFEASYTTEFDFSVGRQQKIADLQNNELTLEQSLKQIDYKIQEDYHRYRKYFIAAMLILPTLLAVLVVWCAYCCYRRFYRLQKRKKFYEKNS